MCFLLKIIIQRVDGAGNVGHSGDVVPLKGRVALQTQRRKQVKSSPVSKIIHREPLKEKKPSVKNIVLETPARQKEIVAQSTTKKLRARNFHRITPISNTIQKPAPSVKSWTVYNENWADKQCEAFVKWLNFIFQPTDDFSLESELLQQKQSQQNSLDPYPIDRISLRTLFFHQKRA